MGKDFLAVEVEAGSTAALLGLPGPRFGIDFFFIILPGDPAESNQPTPAIDSEQFLGQIVRSGVRILKLARKPIDYINGFFNQLLEPGDFFCKVRQIALGRGP